MITKKGWDRNLMLSLFKKEATFNAGVTMSAPNACSMKGFEGEVTYDDKVVNNKDEVTGTEHGTDQELIAQGVKFSYKEKNAKPNSLAGIAALVMGNVASTQDGVLAAYKHKIIPVAVGTALPSIQVEEKFGGIQRAYKGMKGASLKIAAEAGGLVSFDAELLGSGARDASATAFVASITESWMRLSNCKVWMENGSAIAIDAVLTQDLENISSGTPADLKTRIKSFEWSWDNALEGQFGFGGAGVFQDIDYGRRKADLKFTLLFSDATELDHFTNQNPLAIEFDLKGALIAATGTMYYGFHLIVPRFKLKTAPLPKGGAGDTLTQDFECAVFDDGTNPASIIEVYNAKAAYLAV